MSIRRSLQPRHHWISGSFTRSDATDSPDSCACDHADSRARDRFVAVLAADRGIGRLMIAGWRDRRSQDRAM